MIQEQITGQQVIAGARFVLRPLRPSDAGPIAHFAADRRLAEGTPGIPHPFPPGAAEAMVARALDPAREADVWALDGSAQRQGEVLGLITLRRMDRDQSEVSFWVAPGLWNAGFASEAVAALVAANPHRSRTLFAELFQDSPASARVLTHAGFAYLGEAETYSVARNALVPTWTYVRRMG